MNIFEAQLYKYIFLQDYQFILHDIVINLKEEIKSPRLAITPNFIEGLITFHEQANFHKKVILIHDQTYLLDQYLLHPTAEIISKAEIKFINCLEYSHTNRLFEKDQIGSKNEV